MVLANIAFELCALRSISILIPKMRGGFCRKSADGLSVILAICGLGEWLSQRPATTE